MMAIRLLLLLLSLTATIPAAESGPCVPLAAPIRTGLAAVLAGMTSDLATQFNMSFTTGLALCDGTDMGFSSGLDDRFARTPLLPDALVPSGSVTKPWTAVAMLQLVQSGAVALTTPAWTVVDPALQKGWNTTMLTLWDNSPLMRTITIADLLGHTSGINEYPATLQAAVEAGGEFGPIELIDMTDKATLCPRTPCPKYYSSINYVLLGLAMVHLTGAATWTEWDQLSVIPAARRSAYNATAFPKLGKCEAYGDIAHQYAFFTLPSGVTPGEVMYNYVDISGTSCLNGWAMGNIAASGMNLAMFFRDLFAPPNTAAQLLRPDLAAQMVSPTELGGLTNSWACPAMTAPYNCSSPPPQCAGILARLNGGRDCCSCSNVPATGLDPSGWAGCSKGCLAFVLDTFHDQTPKIYPP